jgi:hypothetical protein
MEYMVNNSIAEEVLYMVNNMVKRRSSFTSIICTCCCFSPSYLNKAVQQGLLDPPIPCDACIDFQMLFS